MSKDIWHKADEAPRYRFQCIYYHRVSKEYYFGEYDATFRVFLGKKTFHQDEVWKFAFAEDVIACLDELDRTKKKFADLSDKIGKLETDLERTRKALESVVARNVLDEIKTALEQKDK